MGGVQEDHGREEDEREEEEQEFFVPGRSFIHLHIK
jgi:hypothetical protein